MAAPRVARGGGKGAALAVAIIRKISQVGPTHGRVISTLVGPVSLMGQKYCIARKRLCYSAFVEGLMFRDRGKLARLGKQGVTFCLSPPVSPSPRSSLPPSVTELKKESSKDSRDSDDTVSHDLSVPVDGS
jgi:hypothetical protein